VTTTSDELHELVDQVVVDEAVREFAALEDDDARP
jgi:hypothetical protein